jgi:hypothetical protein
VSLLMTMHACAAQRSIEHDSSVRCGAAHANVGCEQTPQLFAAGPPGPKVSTGAAVSVTKAKKTCFDDTTEITGVLVPKHEVQVRADREGLQIAKVLVEAGAKVSVGQELAQLANTEAMHCVDNKVLRRPFRKRLVIECGMNLSGLLKRTLELSCPAPLARIISITLHVTLGDVLFRESASTTRFRR